MPGRQRRESIKRASVGVYFIGAPRCSKRQLHARRQIEPGHESRVLLLAARRNLTHRVVDGGHEQVFEHVLVLAEQLRLDRHLFRFMVPVQPHLDHARTRLARDLECREFGLRLLHGLLHLLRLTHQIAQSALHHLHLLLASSQVSPKPRLHRRRSVRAIPSPWDPPQMPPRPAEPGPVPEAGADAPAYPGPIAPFRTSCGCPCRDTSTTPARVCPRWAVYGGPPSLGRASKPADCPRTRHAGNSKRTGAPLRANWPHRLPRASCSHRCSTASRRTHEGPQTWLNRVHPPAKHRRRA